MSGRPRRKTKQLESGQAVGEYKMKTHGCKKLSGRHRRGMASLQDRVHSIHFTNVSKAFGYHSGHGLIDTEFVHSSVHMGPSCQKD